MYFVTVKKIVYIRRLRWSFVINMTVLCCMFRCREEIISWRNEQALSVSDSSQTDVEEVALSDDSFLFIHCILCPTWIFSRNI